MVLDSGFKYHRSNKTCRPGSPALCIYDAEVFWPGSEKGSTDASV